MKNKSFKEEQIFDKSLMFDKYWRIVNCYDHFKIRYQERCKKGDLTYENYWLTWIKFLNGKFAYIKDDEMVRVMGNYIKDPSIYKIIYKKIEEYNIYVPLTIYEITDHKKKFHLYQRVLKNKKQKNEN